MKHLQRVWQGKLTLRDTWFRSPFWDLFMLQLIRPVLPNLPYIFLDFCSLHLWNRLTEVNETWQRAKSQHSLPSLFFEPVEKRRWPPQLLIGWDILDLSFETTEQKSTKLERRHDRNVHYQVCCWPVLNFLWQWRETVSKVWDTGVIIICCLDQYRWH